MLAFGAGSESKSEHFIFYTVYCVSVALYRATSKPSSSSDGSLLSKGLDFFLFCFIILVYSCLTVCPEYPAGHPLQMILWMLLFWSYTST